MNLWDGIDVLNYSYFHLSINNRHSGLLLVFANNSIKLPVTCLLFGVGYAWTQINGYTVNYLASAVFTTKATFVFLLATEMFIKGSTL